MGTTLLIQDTLNTLTAGAGTTAVDDNTVSVELTGLTQISLDGGEGEDSITIASSLALGAANLSLAAETLRVNDGLTISTTGDISFSATELGTELGESLSPVNVEQKTATIAIGQNVSLQGDDITVRSVAADTTFLNQLGTNRLVNDFVIGPLANRITDLQALPVKVLFKQSSASVIVGSNTQFLGQGDVSLDAVATANATGSAISDLFSIGYADADASAIVDLATGVVINAGDAVVVRSNGSAIANLTTATEREVNVAFDPTRTALSLGVSRSNLVSNVTVAEGVNITSGKTANIVANGTSDTQVDAKAGSYADGRAGLAFGLGFSDADIKTEVNGTVTANQNPGAIVKWEFDPTRPGAIEFATNRINLAQALGVQQAISDATTQPHALKTGDKVSYSNRRGTSIGGVGTDQITGGLVDGQDYFIVVDPSDPDFIFLAETRVKALAAEQ